MKNFYLSLTLLFISILFISELKAQIPQSFKYQAVARDVNGNVLMNQDVSFKISIKQSSISGEIVYAEIHNVITNQLGLVNLEIGNGTVVLGEFEDINWGDAMFFIQVEMDIEGGTNYQLMGTSQLLSVPYALYAEEAGNTSSLWDSTGDNIYYNDGKVGIGTDTPDISSSLEISSTNTGFLPPRLTTEQRNAIENPAIGLMIFNLSTYCHNFYNGVEWKELCGDNSQWECGDIFIDSRDGQNYNTIKIGYQCWMAENLNIGTRIEGIIDQTNNDIIEKYCYDNDENNCNQFGGLYQWNEIMQYSTVQGIQGICPEGWHLPTDSEWFIMENFVDPTITDPNYQGWRGVDCGEKLLVGGSSRFEGLLAGLRKWDTAEFLRIGESTYFWGSTINPYNQVNTWFRKLNSHNPQSYRNGCMKSFGLSVRCIKD